METLKFDTLPLSKEVLKGIEDMGFEEASPIQALAIPLLLEGRDVIGQAQTGTGKTAAFGIPLLELVDTKSREVQAIVLCPTRELAIQVAEELITLGKHKRGLHVLPIYGGQPIDRQFRALRMGVQVVVGTPGRVMDHMERGTLRLDVVRMSVLDEADEMLDMGFAEDIEHILGAAPEERQTVFFSATMPQPILRLAEKYLSDPAMAKVTPKVLTVPNIEQAYYEAPRHARLDALCRVMDFYNPKLAVVFANTKRNVDEITEQLQTRGYAADALHGDLSQVQRDRVMARFRSGKIEILVATDVAARGIDVDDVEAVFNYDVPSDVEYYVHRIGRTGRAGRSGRAFSFAWGREFYKLRDIQRFTGARIVQSRLPSPGDVAQARAGKFLGLVRETIAKGGLERQLRMVEEFVEKSGEMTEEEGGGATSMELAAALLKMLMGPEAESSGALDRGDGRDDRRAERQPRGNVRDGTRDEAAFDSGMVRLFISAGRAHLVGVKDVVGAIAGETGLTGRLIGKVEVYDRHSFVEVPGEYAEDVIRIMDGNQIRGARINVRVATPRGEVDPDAPESERREVRTPRPPYGAKPFHKDGRPGFGKPGHAKDGKTGFAKDGKAPFRKKPFAKPGLKSGEGTGGPFSGQHAPRPRPAKPGKKGGDD